MKTELLLIDMQYDFCNPKGSLYVPGAEKDCEHVADFIRKNSKSISAVHATLDTHSLYHIAHPVFWKDRNGNPPPAYTMITLDEYRKGLWRPADPSLEKYAEQYISTLESKGRYKLIIWPPHCLIGSAGWTADSKVYDALYEWELEKPGRITDYILKGRCPLTEHYSAIQAEVPVTGDVSTETNTALVAELSKADRIFAAGEALSHCVANTLRDLFKSVSPEKVTLLTDCTSSVKGFEETGTAFVTEYAAKGMKTRSYTDVL